MASVERAAIRIAALYVVVGALWIVLSDRALQALVSEPGALVQWGTMKGWLFVGGSGLLLWALLRRELRNRRAAEGALRRNRAIHDLLVEQVRDHAIVGLDAAGRVASWNEGAQRIVGYPAERIIGQHVSVFHPADQREQGVPESVLQEASTAGHAERAGWRVRSDGRLFWGQVVTTALRDDEGELVGYAEVTRDMTDAHRQDRAKAYLLALEKTVREEAEEAAAWSSFLAESAAMLSRTLEYETSIREVAQLACTRIADWCVIDMVDENGILARHAAACRDSSQREMVDTLGAEPAIDDPDDPANRALATRQPILISNAGNSSGRHSGGGESADVVQKTGSRSLMVVPLVARDRALGVAILASTNEDHDYDATDLDRAVELANLAALAIDNARLFRENENARTQAERAHDSARRQVNRLAALRSIDVAITGSVDKRLALRVVLDQVCGQLGVDAASILLLDRREQVLSYGDGRGFRGTSIRGTRISVGEGAAGRAALDRKVVTHPDLSEAADFVRREMVATEEFVSYVAIPLVAKGQVVGVMEAFMRQPLAVDGDWLGFLEALAGQAAIAIDSGIMFEELQRSSVQLSLSYDRTLEGWSRALEFRDGETQGHSTRVTEMSVRLARTLDLGDEETMHIRRGALLHDIGKMAIPDSILLKPGPLSEAEWLVMRQHPKHAYDLLSPIPFLRPALDIPLFHHEWWNGNGYPYGLKEESIPQAARIFAVVDVWDALSHERPYREAWPADRVQDQIRCLAGVQFDPDIVPVFLRLLEAGPDPADPSARDR